MNNSAIGSSWEEVAKELGLDNTDIPSVRIFLNGEKSNNRYRMFVKALRLTKSI